MELSRGKKQQNVEMGEDRISGLPDCLIHHILSFLDMIYVIRTSILSTRWRHLWISVPALNFDAYEFAAGKNKKDMYKRFLIFVEHVLLLRDNSDIQRFSLTCFEYGETIELSSWIDAVVRCNVQELNLDVGDCSEYLLPDSLFTCKSLIGLSLSSGGCPFLYLPQIISLPCIKTIHLRWLGLTDGILTTRLFSSCPLLESLTIEECDLQGLEELTIDVPRLQHLAVISKCEFGLDFDSIKIKIYAPSLKSFVCDVPMQREYYLYQCSSLEKVDANFESGYLYLDPEYDEDGITEKREVYSQQLRRFLESISMVKALTLSGIMFELLSNRPAIVESLPMKLHNVRYLNLDVCPSRESITGLMHLLKISPSLESLVLKFTRCCGKRHPVDPFFDEDKSNPVNIRDFWEVLPSPQCMLNHLKFVKMYNIEGRTSELNFLKFLHEAALVLKKISVFTCNSPATKKRLMKFNTKLLTFTRASTSLAIFVL